MKKIWILGALLLATSSSAQRLVVTEQPSTYELRNEQSTPISRGHADKTACFAAAPGPGRYKCVEVTVADIVGICENPAPAPVVNAEGFTEVGTLEGHMCPDGTSYSFTQTQPLQDPYPSCAWVERPVPITDCTTLIHSYWTAP